VRPSEANRRHWGEVAGGYSASWDPPAKARLSELELDVVRPYVPAGGAPAVLDVGCGNGRVLGAVLAAGGPGLRSFGVDVAEEMVAVCRERFQGESRVVGLAVCDVAADPVPFEERFALITALRVLKYSENWPAVVAALVGLLDTDGVLVCSMPNRNSLNRLSRPYAVPWYSATPSELSDAVAGAGARVLEMRGFARLPYVLYRRLTGPRTSAAVTAAERVLSAGLGPQTLARELFVVGRRDARAD